MIRIIRLNNMNMRLLTIGSNFQNDILKIYKDSNIYRLTPHQMAGSAVFLMDFIGLCYEDRCV